MTSTFNRRSAFTLVEMMVALGLTAALMLGVLAATASLARTHRAAGETAPNAQRWQQRTLDLIRWDLSNSQALALPDLSPAVADVVPANAAHPAARRRPAAAVALPGVAGRIEMVGYAALRPDTFAPEHRPVRVVYRVWRDTGSSWLVREQTDLDDPRAATWSQVVCGGVESLSVRPLPAPHEPPVVQFDFESNANRRLDALPSQQPLNGRRRDAGEASSPLPIPPRLAPPRAPQPPAQARVGLTWSDGSGVSAIMTLR